ncbi:4-hydroxy-4-methyl-2-oxoglutarate aldolase [Polystyrenella longa]|uniref:Putative 4-hydroxy-4-methyl-2-oxoglutarate aldolase n=1 Tax=Polystyrenella longa TaxID=2528007 RepID=A0A518CPH2_9PLAN|nr:RraA family protein [Polystyrenella longa]QDU81119.1 4-hydroxy-4-methyl-2-oxoglutarate aldolase [Polystyrenella longa]
MEITLELIREKFYTAVLCDVLDSLGFRHQSPRIELRPLTVDRPLVGRCKTTLWMDMAHEDPNPYEQELKAVDSCQPDDVIIAAAQGSRRSGIWGELLSTAARNQGCVGALINGCVRDVRQMREMDFLVYAAGTSPYDSQHRQRVVEYDVPVEIDGVRFESGDLVMADIDGVVVVPRQVELQVLQDAWGKINAENVTRDAIKAGMKATEAYEKFGVL